MFFIWGWRAVLTVLGAGQFSCPQCLTDTEYQHVQQRQWFTVFFLPVVPLQQLGTHVRCTRCNGAFLDVVLDRLTMPQLEHHLGLASRAVVAHLVSLSPRSVAVEDAAIECLSTAPGVQAGYGHAQLAADVVAFTSPAVVGQYVTVVARHLTLEGREHFLRRAMTVGARLETAGGTGLAVALTAYGDLLELTRAHVAGIAAQLDATTAGGEW